VAALPEVNQTFNARQLLSFVIGGRKLPNFEPGPHGIVLFLGGDLAYAALLARKLGYLAYAYTEGRVQWASRFAGFLLPDDQARMKAIQSGAPPDKLYVVGDLMLDAIRFHWEKADLQQSLRLDEDRAVIALFPGSRPHEFRYMLPMFLRAAEIISRDLRAVQFVVSVSPFVTEDFLADALAHPGSALEGTGGEIVAAGDSEELEEVALSRTCHDAALGHVWQIKTWGGLLLAAVQGWQYDIMGLAALGITIPGSNTAEMAALGIPMVVVTPLNKPEAIPLQGIPGLVGSIPLVGRHIKRKAVLAAAKRVQFAALPNRKAQAEVVPELKGELRPEDIAIAVGNLMRHPEKLKSISDKLKRIMGPSGAANMIAETLAAVLDS
jgi:lipid A disaccharide synthetase